MPSGRNGGMPSGALAPSFSSFVALHGWAAAAAEFCGFQLQGAAPSAFKVQRAPPGSQPVVTRSSVETHILSSPTQMPSMFLRTSTPYSACDAVIEPSAFAVKE